MCSAGRDGCWAGGGLIKNKSRQPTRRRGRDEDKKIHASAQLTIKPNYLWIGLMGHMLGSKFPDQEVTWEGALVHACVCVCASMCVCVSVWVFQAGQCVRDKKIRAERRRLGARSWLSAISSIKQIYLAFRQFDQNPEIPLEKIS